MYSILIQTSPNSGKYSYYLNSDATVYTTDDLTALGTKVGELLETYVMSQIVPIKNCIIEKNITITEATV
jgi:hypothetical protein